MDISIEPAYDLSISMSTTTMNPEDIETQDVSVRGLRLFGLDEMEEIVLHPPMKRFVERWRPGDPSVYLGSLWIP